MAPGWKVQDMVSVTGVHGVDNKIGREHGLCTSC
jgi:hypothetical protein